MKAKHIGIVACSAEGAALCYRTIAAESMDRLGEHYHPEITMHTFPLARYMEGVDSGDWKDVGDLMVKSAQILAKAGADFAICPDNTIHEAFDFVKDCTPIPWLHIGDVVAKTARARGYKCIGVTGTKYLMTGPVYPKSLVKEGLEYRIPGPEEREEINRIIFKELTFGVFTERSRHYFNKVYQKLEEQGADAAVLGCTEIPLLVKPDDCPLPTLDSTRLLARAAIEEALCPACS